MKQLVRKGGRAQGWKVARLHLTCVQMCASRLGYSAPCVAMLVGATRHFIKSFSTDWCHKNQERPRKIGNGQNIGKQWVATNKFRELAMEYELDFQNYMTLPVTVFPHDTGQNKTTDCQDTIMRQSI